MQEINPAKYHEAWKTVVGAGCVFASWRRQPRGPSDSSDRGILVPGGFGQRGTEGMMLAIKWAREQKIPFLGICLGFQLAVIEWARNVCGLAGKSHTPVSKPPRHPMDGVGAGGFLSNLPFFRVF